MTPQELQQALMQAHRLFASGDLAGAERTLRDVLKQAPNEPNTLNLLAGVKRQAGDRATALALFDAALMHAPKAAPIQFNRANLLLEMGRREDAVRGYDAALALRPDHAESHLNRARALAELERAEEALESYARAIALGLDTPPAWSGRAATLFALGRHAEALASFDACIAANANDFDAHYNRARCLQALDRLEEALSAYDRAAALAPANADLLHNRAVLLQWLDRRAESVADFDAALALRPDHGPLLYTKGIALLSFGDYAQAWPLHELRHRPGVLPAMRDESRGEPVWRGERLDGALRIWAEQGIGDEVLFARLVPLARARTPNVMLECAGRLVPLFARAFPDIAVHAFGAAPPAAAQIAIGSLGHALNATEADFGAGMAYLSADPARLAAIRARYQAFAKERPLVGIAWISKNPRIGAHKSASLSEWGALLTRDCAFVNLQYGDTIEEVAVAERQFGCTIHTDAHIDQMADLDAFAAQIAALDHIVSVSNTTVHLAGALGIPCTLLAPPAQGLLWYWGVWGETTPWYESVRVMRRAAGESWQTQIARVAADFSLRP